jgi:predicted NBD/HSP70 family sugar kinase
MRPPGSARRALRPGESPVTARAAQLSTPFAVIRDWVTRDCGMADTTTITPATGMVHGAVRLPAVDVASYSLELRGEEGFLGDHANKGVFRAMLDDWRKVLRKYRDDPFGKKPSEQISKKELEALLVEGDIEAAAAVHAAIEDFARELARVISNFLEIKSWKGVERLVIGGGFRETRVGELAIARASIILKSKDIGVDIRPIRHEPDPAGLIGAAHLAPSWMFKGYDAVLAADIGGTNMRAGLVLLNLKGAPDLSKAEVDRYELWRHADDKPKRDEAVEELAEMLGKLIAYAGKEGHKVAPFIGIGCPGRIEEGGAIDRARRICPAATGPAKASTFRPRCTSRFPSSASMRRPCCCTTTLSCRA